MEQITGRYKPKVKTMKAFLIEKYATITKSGLLLTIIPLDSMHAIIKTVFRKKTYNSQVQPIV